MSGYDHSIAERAQHRFPSRASRRLGRVRPSALVVTLSIVVAIAIAAGAIFALHHRPATAAKGGSAMTSGGSRVAVLKLTTSERYDAIAVVGGRILLCTTASRVLKGSSTFSTCVSAFVNPWTLTLTRRRGSCADPALFGRSVIPAISTDSTCRRLAVGQARSSASPI